MNKTHNTALTSNAKKLRSQMTPQERKLWYEFFRLLPFTVNRQKVIGRYIADFYIASAHLVVELDGSQHYLDEGFAADADRDRYLRSLGLTVRRYTNLDISHHFADVCEDILLQIKLGQEGKTENR